MIADNKEECIKNEDKDGNGQLCNKEEKVGHAKDVIDDDILTYEKYNVDYLHARLSIQWIFPQDLHVDNVGNQLLWLRSKELIEKVANDT